MSQTNCECEKPVVRVPVRGLEFALDEEALKSIQFPPVIGAGLPVGSIQLLPFRRDEMPLGWYVCDGSVHELTSTQGQALNALPMGFKQDWKIIAENGFISLPKLFNDQGKGYFFRPVDGVLRAVGSAEGDAIRNITGRCGGRFGKNDMLGALHTMAVSYNNTGPASMTSSSWIEGWMGFDSSKVVPTADENRPLNIGMLPAIFLGV